MSTPVTLSHLISLIEAASPKRMCHYNSAYLSPEPATARQVASQSTSGETDVRACATPAPPVHYRLCSDCKLDNDLTHRGHQAVRQYVHQAQNAQNASHTENGQTGCEQRLLIGKVVQVPYRHEDQ